MNLTLLLDLDDTLLINNIEGFLPAYLKALSTHLVKYVEPKAMVPCLLAATQAMVYNRHPDRTLKQVFDAHFYPELGLDLEEMQQPLADFYSEVFPTLKPLTQPRPEAMDLVNEAVRRGYQLAIATNPLFPLTAIEQRLSWAGISLHEVPLRLISSYETFHFSKQHVAYYAELLARLGWPDGPVIMVGDDLDRDIAPARKLGIQAWWLPKDGVTKPNGLWGPSNSGGLEGLFRWIDSQPEEALKPDFNLPSAMLAILRSTPAVIDTLCSDLPDDVWLSRPAPEEWCPTEVICHLRDVDREVNLPRVQTMLAEENPFIPGKDTDPWAQERQYVCQNGAEALHEFTNTRLELLNLLEELPEDGWKRTARHAIFGPTTLAEVVSINAGHDRLHVQQIMQALQAATTN